MLDLETLGTLPDSAITQIAAVEFYPHAQRLGRSFYARIGIKNAVADGGTVDGATLEWWMTQDYAARTEVLKGDESGFDALVRLRGWFPKRCMAVWGNGAGFDNVILAEGLRSYEFGQLWHYRADRCYRTLRALFPAVPFQPLTLDEYHDLGLTVLDDFAPLPHCALWDAITQAHHCMQLLAKLAARAALAQKEKLA